jgi:riboflavin kinase/FMN adenylyltransferase
VDEAGALLGHHYAIEGTVVAGDGRGRRIGVPTANLATENELVPPGGVYATVAIVDGRYRASVTNIGHRPTFGPGALAVETHLLDYDGDLYGRTLQLAFVQRVRDERAFPDVDALVAQIAADCRRARALFQRVSL